MDHNIVSTVHLLTHPGPCSEIDSDRLLEIIIDIAGYALIEFELESTVPEVCVETAAALGIAGCAVVEFDEASRTIRTVGWSSEFAGEVTGELAGEMMRLVHMNATPWTLAVQPLDPSIGLATAAAARLARLPHSG